MSDLTAKFEALEEQLDAADAATQAKLIAMQDALDLINAQLDTQTLNNAANTRYLLSALGTLNPCTDCEGVSITVPPTDTGAVTLDQDLCKRVQAFLHAMESVYTVLDTMSAFGVGFSTTILTDAYNTVITALENGDTTPLPSFPEMVQIVGDGVSYIASNLLVGHTLVGLFTPLYFDLLNPLYEAGSAAGIQSAFNAFIEGTDYGVFEKRLLQHAAYNELYSYYFDPGTAPNLTGYNGTLCGDPENVYPPTTGCYVVTSQLVSVSNGSPIQAIVWPDGAVDTVPMSASGAASDLVASETIFGFDNIRGMSASAVPGCHVYWEATGNPNFDLGPVAVALPGTGGNYYTFLHATTQFTLTICAVE